ncbi:hypothetical protein BA723_08305 [Helicobacter sp. CLO-3]|nr:hypothetical protein BA723_08305 [Helicobacter sp. CLO-3]
MAKNKAQECPAGEKWAVPYADFLSLLLALFIALWAISSTESSKAKALSEAFTNFFDRPPVSRVFQPIFQRPPDPGEVREDTEGKNPQTADGSASSVAIKDSISQIQLLIQEGGVLEQIEQGIILRLPADLLFESGRADLNSEEMKMYVRRIAEIINKLPKEIKIDVRGYTDDAALSKDSAYKSHYELASARAYAVMRGLLANGVDPANLSYSSYGAYSPVAPNTTTENRAKNNRVEIFLSTTPNNIRAIKSVLDGGNGGGSGGAGAESGAGASALDSGAGVLDSGAGAGGAKTGVLDSSAGNAGASAGGAGALDSDARGAEAN